ncbi:MAG: ABC transporter [Gammaproteobacteria bacterium TMED119]|nr:MAG: ABC transporter [Gammaproteobacteria bacterium TMED119]|tara:strand:- start:2507 stop:3427 length:921 start_codon:yes stop_codon:yes gene_type:complete
MIKQPAALHIDNLVKRYANNVLALDHISFNVEQGDFFALLGPNGAGKSTTLGIICSLVNKTAGKVEIFGKDIDYEFSKAKKMIGLVPQEFNFNGFEPIEEIIAHQAGYYGIERHSAKERAAYNLNMLGLWEKRRSTPRQLSGGMKRRLMIARALVHDPELLILDEPTAGVDIEIRRSMWELLQKLNADGRTIILTTHYLEEAETLCKNVGIINHGKIIIDAPMRDLLDQLKRETFIFYLSEPAEQAPTLASALCTKIDARTLEITLDHQSQLDHVFHELAALNIGVVSMRNKSNRLEELFINLVNT